MTYIRYHKDEWIGELTISRPEALNALNSELLTELSAVLDEVQQDTVRALIVTGYGEKSFVAGADILEMWKLSPEQADLFCRVGNDVMSKMENLPMPVIAAVNGYALGGGCELALSCDIRLASDRAVFGFPEVSLGIIPGYGGLQRLSRLIGPGRAKRLVFTAERIRAAEAMAMGLVDQVCTADGLLEAARVLAVQISSNAPVAVGAAKRVMNASAGLTLEECRYLETEEFAGCFKTRDQYRAMGAFLKQLEPAPFEGK